MRDDPRESRQGSGLRRRSFLALLMVPAIPAGSAAAVVRDRAEQSPIDFRTADLERYDLPELRFAYSPSATVNLTYISTDDSPCDDPGEEETVRAEVAEGDGMLWIGEREYTLEQVHWHTRSEHLRNGRRFPLEQHLVHTDDSGNHLVVGVWLRYGRRHDMLGRLFADLPNECTPDRTIQGVDLNRLLPDEHRSMRYPGSLTTDPYSEGVSWIMLARPMALSRAQAERFAALFPHGNSRHVQPLNDRTVRTEARP